MFEFPHPSECDGVDGRARDADGVGGAAVAANLSVHFGRCAVSTAPSLVLRFLMAATGNG